VDNSFMAHSVSALLSSALEMRARSFAVLEKHRSLMQRSVALIRQARATNFTVANANAMADDRRLLERSRALLDRSKARRSATVENFEIAVPRSPAVLVKAASPRCGRAGCDRPGMFRPTFMIGLAQGRVAVPNLPLRVCEEHRDHLISVFRDPRILVALRRVLRARGAGDPGQIRIAFQIVN
jgi:hypothetical protein